MLRFESPWLLSLLLFMPLLGLWSVLEKRLFPLRRRQPAGLRYADVRLVTGLNPSWRLRLRPILQFLRGLVISLMIIGLARPQSGQSRQVIKGEGVDIALALDISGSMASLDFEPDNRLAAAKGVIEEFIASRQYDRIGLVVFASNAFYQSPPTIDHSVLSRLVQETQLSTDLGIEDGTAIGTGLANAANMLKDSPAKSKIVILLTDGVNNQGQIDPLTAAKAAESLGIKVYTVGMGRPGEVPMPVVDAFGRERIVYQESALDEEALQQVADLTGGLYFRAEDTAGLEQIYAEINALEKSQVEVTTYTRYTELMVWVLVPALMLLILEMVMRQTVFRAVP